MFELLWKEEISSVKVPLSGLTLYVRATFNRTSPKKDKIKNLLKFFFANITNDKKISIKFHKDNSKPRANKSFYAQKYFLKKKNIFVVLNLI